MEHPYLDRDLRAMGPWEILVWIAATEMIGPFHRQLWLGSHEEIHVKSRKGNLTVIFAAKSARQHTRVSLSGQTGRNAGIICNASPGKEHSATEGSHCRNNSQKTKGAEGAAD